MDDIFYKVGAACGVDTADAERRSADRHTADRQLLSPAWDPNKKFKLFFLGKLLPPPEPPFKSAWRPAWLT